MDMTRLIRLLPTMEVLVEEFRLAGWPCEAWIPDPDRCYRNVRLYTGQQELLEDVVYALPPGATDFPTDDYAYICSTPLSGEANHICSQDAEPGALLDFLLERYSRFQQQEMMIDQLTYGNGDLQSLCQLGETLLQNPVCLHDEWFIVIGMSQGATPLMKPEYLMTSTVGFLPRVILDDFHQDSEYLETYSQTEPQIWSPPPPSPVSLYVNLWDNSIYRGRLVILQQNRPIRKLDYILAQVITQRAIFMLQRKQHGTDPRLQSMDDIVYSILSGKTANPADLSQLLRTLRWDMTGNFVCIRIRSQQGVAGPVMEHLLHSDLFQVFPDSYVLLGDQEQCLLLNLEDSSVSYWYIPHLLAPLCRDYCLYAGISSPVKTVQEWNLAYYQAGIALDQAFLTRNEKWIIPFSQCALDHILKCQGDLLRPEHMVAPELLYLRRHDQEKGTQYYETFREYLLQERDIPRTSEALIIHRTTLLYRLKKIQSLVHMDLENPWQRLYLMLSLWILEKEIQP